MTEISIGFVVLHYNTLKSTIDTINSIKISVSNCEIVVVDNNSPNKSGTILKKIYSGDTKVKVIILHDNLGFSKGNNIGYNFLKHNFDCKYICITNNDIVFLDENLLEHLEDAYQKYSFGVLGPKIILKDDTENIFNPNIRSVEKIKNDILLLQREKKRIEKRSFLGQKVRDFTLPLRKKIGLVKNENEGKHYEVIQNILLHGCCLFFSPDFINKFDKAFLELTFLYCEEEILFLRCRSNNISTLYYDKILVRHLEEVSTNSLTNDYRKKRINQLNYLIKANKVLLNYMNKTFNNFDNGLNENIIRS